MHGVAPELQEPGFLWMERQPIFRESLVQGLEYPFCIFSVLKAENEIIRETDFVSFPAQAGPDLLLEPLVQHIMEVDIRQQRAG